LLRLWLAMTKVKWVLAMTNWVMTQPLNCHFNCKAKALPHILGKTYILLPNELGNYNFISLFEKGFRGRIPLKYVQVLELQ